MAKRFVKERWEVEWQELTAAAKLRQQAEQDGGPLYEHDRDRDEETLFEVFTTEAKARAYAREIVDSKVTVYGHALVTHQRLEQIEGTRMWDWENISEPEYVE